MLMCWNLEKIKLLATIWIFRVKGESHRGFISMNCGGVDGPEGRVSRKWGFTLDQALCSPGRAGSAEPWSGLLMLSQLLQEQSQDPALKVSPESSQDGGRHQNPLPTSDPAPQLSAETSVPLCVPHSWHRDKQHWCCSAEENRTWSFFPKFLLIWTPWKWGRACEVLLWSLGIPQLLPGLRNWVPRCVLWGVSALKSPEQECWANEAPGSWRHLAPVAIKTLKSRSIKWIRRSYSYIMWVVREHHKVRKY